MAENHDPVPHVILPPAPALNLHETSKLIQDLVKIFAQHDALLDQLRITGAEFTTTALQLTQCEEIKLVTWEDIHMAMQLMERYPNWVFKASVYNLQKRMYLHQYFIELLPRVPPLWIGQEATEEDEDLRGISIWYKNVGLV